MSWARGLWAVVLSFALSFAAFAQERDSVRVAAVADSVAMGVAVPDTVMGDRAVSDSVAVAAPDSVAPKRTKVYLEHANTLSFDKERNADAQILNGDVCFRHDSSYMYCDSAYFFEATNSLEAFSNVRMEQGDTLFVYGNYLFYDGNTRIAYLRENVRMENGQVTLFTDSTIASVWRTSVSPCIPIRCITARTRRSRRYWGLPSSCRIAARFIRRGAGTIR